MNCVFSLPCFEISAHVALLACIRELLEPRFLASLNITRLPLKSSATDPHVPVLTSANLATAKRTIIYFGEESQDLGIFAYRILGQNTLSAGSALDFISAVQSSRDDVGVIIANLGQLLWYRRGQRAVTRTSWNALPRKTAVSDPFQIHPVKNHIPGNEDWTAHVKSVFEEVVLKMANPQAKLDIIGLGDGASEAVAYLQSHWTTWKDRVQAIAVGAGYNWAGDKVHEPEFVKFWGKVCSLFQCAIFSINHLTNLGSLQRARAYLLSPEPVDTPLSGREDFGCNCYSSGGEIFTECIMPQAHKAMLAFFKLVADVPGYQELEGFQPLDDMEGKVILDEK